MNLPMIIAALLLALSAAGVQFSATGERDPVPLSEQARARALAAGMATYRAAVTAYFTAHPGQSGRVAHQTLVDEGLIPSWSAMNLAQWSHFRMPDGIIYVYAVSVPQPDPSAALLALGRDSLMIGSVRADSSGQARFYSSLGGATAVAAPAAADAAIPPGSPVWLAMRN
jgi:hypothetical protein